MSAYRLTEPALSDLDGIVSYLTEEASWEVAERVALRILKSCENLAEMPRMGRVRPDLTPQSVRWWPMTQARYIIIYDAETAPLEILRIVDGARDLLALFTAK